ncbi:MAG: hypothetical protein IPO36_07875 [Anaerolineales bacterium]|nr:hypothetical protein [Anaerolineales bacterium]
MDNWPGMKDRYRFTVPCPEIINGQPCKGRFNIHALREILAEGDTTIRCQECANKQSITELLLGFEERDMSVQLQEIKEQLAGMDSRIANYFMAPCTPSQMKRKMVRVSLPSARVKLGFHQATSFPSNGTSTLV